MSPAGGRPWRRRLLAALVAGALIAAGCGSEDEEPAGLQDQAEPPPRAEASADRASKPSTEGDRGRKREDEDPERHADRDGASGQRSQAQAARLQRIRELLGLPARDGERPDPDERRRIAERLRELLERQRAGGPGVTDAARHSLSRKELREALAERERRQRAIEAAQERADGPPGD